MKIILTMILTCILLTSCKEEPIEAKQLEQAQKFSLEEQILLGAIQELCEEQGVCGNNYSALKENSVMLALEKVQLLKDRMASCEFYFVENSETKIAISVKNCGVEFTNEVLVLDSGKRDHRQIFIKTKVLDLALISDIVTVNEFEIQAESSLVEQKTSDSEFEVKFRAHSLILGNVEGQGFIKGRVEGNRYEGHYDFTYLFQDFLLHGVSTQLEQLTPHKIISGSYTINKVPVAQKIFSSVFGLATLR